MLVSVAHTVQYSADINDTFHSRDNARGLGRRGPSEVHLRWFVALVRCGARRMRSVVVDVHFDEMVQLAFE